MRKAFILLFALLLGSLAQAQVQTNFTLLNSTALGPSTTTYGTATSLGQSRKYFIQRIVGTRTAGAGTLDARIEHSPVCGSSANWKTLESFTQQNAAGPTTEDVHINHVNTAVYPCVRAVAVVGAGALTSWNVVITLSADEGK